MDAVPDRPPPARTRKAPRVEAPDPAAPRRYKTGLATMELVLDRHDPRGRILTLDGVPSSYVHLDDPTRLEFEYVRWIGDLLDVMAAPDAPLRVAHIGGAGCTLPRYVTATRPGSPQVVFEYDPRLADFVREAFDLRRDRRLRLRVGDGRAGVASLRDGSQDVVIRDAFVGDRVPGHLTTAEFHADVARVLAPGGVYAVNVADRTTTYEARIEAATLLTVFRHVVVVAEPAQLRGRRFGNVVVFGSDASLPEAALTRRLASGAVRARLLPTERVRELAAGQAVRRDADLTSESPDGAAEGEKPAHGDSRGLFGAN